MDSNTYIALSRMDAQQRSMAVTADNIANASTTGYKRESVLFNDFLLSQHSQKNPEGADQDAYTQDRATYRDFQQGDLQQTGNPLDLALGGEGYFQVKTSNGIRLTRSGRFEEERNGAIVDEQGEALLNQQGQPVILPQNDHQITVASDGTISTESGQIDKIGIVTVRDKNELKAEGSKLMRADQLTDPLDRPNITQGSIESSNVHMMSEMTRMMDMQRNFDLMAQFVDSEGKRQQNAIDKIIQVSA